MKYTLKKMIIFFKNDMIEIFNVKTGMLVVVLTYIFNFLIKGFKINYKILAV